MKTRFAPLVALAVACGSGGPASTRAAAGASDDAGPTATPEPPFDAGSITLADGAVDDAGPFPLGGTWGSAAVHFRVRADAATRVEVDLYDTAKGADEKGRISMTRGAPGEPWAADVAHADLAALGIAGAVFYGYRAWGPNWPYSSDWTKGSSAGFIADVDTSGNRFKPNKLLFDPYAL